MLKTLLFLGLCLLLSGCQKTAYNPSYIISDTASQQHQINKED